MTFNKFIISFLISIFLGSVGGIQAQAAPIRVVAITQDFASIAEAVGGDRVSVTALVKGSQDLHHVNARPSMVLSVRNADLMIRLGMDQDTWIDDIIKKAGNRKIFRGSPGYLDASSQVEKLDVPSKIDGQGDIHKYGNPHYWLSPTNAKIIAKEIAGRLIQIDPENASFYTENLTQFNREIDRKMVEWRRQLGAVSGVAVVSYHGEWRYFLAEFNLKDAGHLEPFPGVPPTIRHLAGLRETFMTSPKRLVWAADFYDESVVRQFARQSKCDWVMTPANVGSGKTRSYIELIDTLVKALTQNA